MTDRRASTGPASAANRASGSSAPAIQAPAIQAPAPRTPSAQASAIRAPAIQAPAAQAQAPPHLSNPRKRLFVPVPYTASQSWNLREHARHAQLRDGSREASLTRLSHVLTTGVVVHEDIVLKHGRQLSAEFVATHQNPHATLHAAKNDDKILTIRGTYTDQRERKFKYELEVIFADQILQVLWHALTKYRGATQEKQKWLTQVRNAYAGIENEDAAFVYDLYKRNVEDERQAQQAYERVCREEQQAQRAAEQARLDAMRLFRSNQAAEAGTRMHEYIEEAIACMRGKVMAERWAMKTVNPNENERVEAANNLGEWYTFCNQMMKDARRLRQAQKDRVKN